MRTETRGELGVDEGNDEMITEFDVGKSELGTKNHQGSSRAVESDRGSKQWQKTERGSMILISKGSGKD